jgi:hypothetical protein
MNLPNRIFFTGVPGSRWSGVAQIIESIEGFNTSDRTPERTYDHHSYSGHKGAYFGWRMEFEPVLLWDGVNNIDQAWKETGGCRLVKSHNWPDKFDEIEKIFPDDWIMLVYRPDMTSFAWWHEAGGFQIKYPSYKWYQDEADMLHEISRNNKLMLKYACEKRATWNYFTPEWIKENFNVDIEVPMIHDDILVTLIK